MGKTINFQKELDKTSFESYLRMTSSSNQEAEKLIRLNKKHKKIKKTN